MSGKEARNVTASVLAKLRNNSKSSGAPFQQVLQLYAMERFLYRISQSGYAHSVILKGALLLKTIGIPSARPTVDIDMLRKGKADHASLVALIKTVRILKSRPTALPSSQTVWSPKISPRIRNTREHEFSWTRAWTTCV
jgi:hypothetical protein